MTYHMMLQAVLLTVGRLCCMLNSNSTRQSRAGCEELARMALTLLLDTLASEDSNSLSQVDACAVYTLACLGVSYGLTDCRLVIACSHIDSHDCSKSQVQ